MAVHSSMRILVVEDDPGDVLIIRDVIESLEHRREIDVVGDGREAWAFLNHEGPYADAPRPDVILLDLNMPRMDGRELLLLLKADPSLRSIPTVIFTTSAADEDIRASYESYANAYVTKPLDFDSLTAAVEQIDAFFTRLAALPPRSGRRSQAS